MMAKRGARKPIVILYFSVLLFLVFILILHMFRLYYLQTDFFAKFLISLIVVIGILPMVPRVKIFDLIEVKRETRILKNRK